MSESMDPKFLDKRTRNRYLQTGVLEGKILDGFLKSLPDVADKAASVDTLMGVEGYAAEESTDAAVPSGADTEESA